jgi:lipoic acid synthetase
LLAHAKRHAPGVYTTSSIMVGLGETLDEVREAMRALRDVGVDILTLGQYLRPTPKHLAVERFVTPDEFAMLQAEGMEMGFRYVASGPLVRSSYKAAEAFVRRIERLCVESGVPRRLSELGVTVDQIDWLAEHSGGASMRGNPVQLATDELRRLLSAML